MHYNQQDLYAVLRSDLASFIHKVFNTIDKGTIYSHSWHIEAIAWHLEQVYQGKIHRLIITLPPRNLKSIAASVAFPAWLLGQDPTKQIITVSYAQELAIKHGLDTRRVMEQDWYKKCFPRTRISAQKDTQSEFTTTQNGFRMCTSIGGTLTGRGGNVIIIDDPHKPDEMLSVTKRRRVHTWHKNTLIPRANDKQHSAIILIQQRLHEDDLAGHLLETGGWTHLNIPAIAEEAHQIQIGDHRFHIREKGDAMDENREPRQVLDKIKHEIGSYNFSAQYQQRPVPAGGGIIKWDWIQHYDTAPDIAQDNQIVQSWDCASKVSEMNDYSVCTTWLVKDNCYYLLDVLRKRLEFPALKKIILQHAMKWDASYVLIEDMNAGIALIQDLQKDSDLSIIPVSPTSDKETRMMTVSPIIESGRVFMPSDASWLATFHHEIVTFPKGKYDDQVDSVSQFLNWVREHGSTSELRIRWA